MTTPRKKPIMNNPYMTQTQTEQRIASRLASPEKIRRAFRLDNPHMWGERTGYIPGAGEEGLIPTPLYETATGSILDPRLFARVSDR